MHMKIISDDMTIKQSDVNDNVDAAADNIQETILYYCNISSEKIVKLLIKIMKITILREYMCEK